MRLPRLLAPLLFVAQPAGMDPVPVAFAFVPGPTSAASAQERALGMIRAVSPEVCVGT